MSLYQVPNPTECGLVELDAGGQSSPFCREAAPEEVFTDLAKQRYSLICDPALYPRCRLDRLDFGRFCPPCSHRLPGHGATDGWRVCDRYRYRQGYTGHQQLPVR